MKMLNRIGSSAGFWVPLCDTSSDLTVPMITVLTHLLYGLCASVAVFLFLAPLFLASLWNCCTRPDESINKDRKHDSFHHACIFWCTVVEGAWQMHICWCFSPFLLQVFVDASLFYVSCIIIIYLLMETEAQLNLNFHFLLFYKWDWHLSFLSSQISPVLWVQNSS